MCWFKLCNVSENTARDFRRLGVRLVLCDIICLTTMHLLFSASSELKFGALAAPTEKFYSHYDIRDAPNLSFFPLEVTSVFK